jgi:hypothetical protein
MHASTCRPMRCNGCVSQNSITVLRSSQSSRTIIPDATVHRYAPLYALPKTLLSSRSLVRQWSTCSSNKQKKLWFTIVATPCRVKKIKCIVYASRMRPRPSGLVHPNPLSGCDVESQLFHTVRHYYRCSCGMARLKDMMQEVSNKPLAFLT